MTENIVHLSLGHGRNFNMDYTTYIYIYKFKPNPTPDAGSGIKQQTRSVCRQDDKFETRRDPYRPILSLRFNGDFPGEPGLAGVY